jgi:YD repeat-containing protein
MSSQTGTVPMNSIEYEYDSLYRLKSAKYHEGEDNTGSLLDSYKYDLLGNRTKQIINNQTTTYLYGGTQLSQETRPSGVYDYFYDLNGNRTEIRRSGQKTTSH